jgi:hypothetical protein
MAAARSGSRRVFLIASAFQRKHRLQAGWSLSSGLTSQAMSGRNCRIPSLCRITGVRGQAGPTIAEPGEPVCNCVYAS